MPSRPIDLGLPLVRGPFGSLTAARTAIEVAREGDAPVSPLAARVDEERLHPRPARPAAAKPGKSAAATGAGHTKPAPKGPSKSVPAKAAKPPEPRPPPAPPPEPAWIGEQPAARRRQARQLIERLTVAGLSDAEAIARAEFVDSEPAVARIAIERQLRRAIDAKGTDRAALGAAIVGLLAAGEDSDLGVRWRLVDGEGRPIAPIPTSGPDRS